MLQGSSPCDVVKETMAGVPALTREPVRATAVDLVSAHADMRVAEVDPKPHPDRDPDDVIIHAQPNRGDGQRLEP